ncbi:solute carrier family 22 member 15-like [Mytilus galloprovincialis]|uniref:solute carrier family 22 member 15-like n=1 Tax=Mytilus galloprovincialis TaxID=29158 RepID=UPI003F7B5CD3
MKEKEDACAKAFESVLDEVGHFGYFQKRLFFLTSCLQILATPVILYFGLLTELPVIYSYKCSDTTTTYSEEITGTCVNISVAGPIKNLPQWMYTNQTSGDVNVVFYVQTTGLVLGTIIGGFVADLLGRKHILFLSYAIMMISHALVAACSDFVCFGTGRFVTNFFAGSFIVPSTVLYMEYLGRNWRDICICTCLWWFGTIILSIGAVITYDWRYLAVIFGVLGVPMSGFYFLFPESFRWYCCRQKFNEAEHILREMTSCNSHKKPDVTSVCDNITMAVINTMRVRTYTYLDIFKTKRLITSITILSFASCISCIVYRCLMERVWDLTNNIYIDNSLRYIVDLPIIFSAMVISKCIGRRWCIFLYAMSSGFAMMCVIVLTVVDGLLKDEEIITGIALFGKLGVASTIIFLFLVALEVFPTTIRCMGTALVFTSCICGLTVGRYICTVLNQSFHYTSTFIGYGTFMCFVGFISLLLPETYNQPLPDIVKSRHRIIASQDLTRIAHDWNKM